MGYQVSIDYTPDEEQVIIWLAKRYDDHSDRAEPYHVKEAFPHLDDKQIRKMLERFERHELLSLNNSMGAVLSPKLLVASEAIRTPEPVDQVAQTQRWWYSTRAGLWTFIALAALFVVGQVVSILADLKTLLDRPDIYPAVAPEVPSGDSSPDVPVSNRLESDGSPDSFSEIPPAPTQD